MTESELRDEWSLTESEVSALGYLHGDATFVPERKPHDRCRCCGDPWPCVSLRLVRELDDAVSDMVVAWLMFGIVYVLWWLAAYLHRRRRRRELELWSRTWGHRSGGRGGL